MTRYQKKILITSISVALIVALALVLIFQYRKQKEYDRLKTNVYNGVQESTKMYAEGYIGVVKNLHPEDITALADTVANATAGHVVVGELKKTDFDVMVDAAKAALADEINRREIVLTEEEQVLLAEGVEAIVIETIGKTYDDNGTLGQDAMNYLTENLSRRLDAITIVMGKQTDGIYTDIVALEQLIATLKANTSGNADIVALLQKEMLELQSQLDAVNVDNATVDGQNTAIFASLKSIQEKIKALGDGYDKSLDNLSKDIDSILKNGTNGSIFQKDMTKLKSSLSSSTDSLKKTVSQHTTQISTLNTNMEAAQAGVDKNKQSIDSLKQDTEENISNLSDEIGGELADFRAETDDSLAALQQKVDTKLVAKYSIKNGKPTITFSNVLSDENP